MEVLSHRGYWQTADEKNELVAFARSFSLGFGTETDVRDHDGRLVIAHDAPTGEPLEFSSYLASLTAHARRPLPQAINIKADGLASLLANAMKTVAHPWFVFDMSVPDMLAHLRVGNPVYARLSEYEPFPGRLRDQVSGFWLDAFNSTWYTTDTIRSLLDSGTGVCVVSPELHGRTDAADLWAALRPLATYPNLSLCTDLPEVAADALGIPYPAP